jgi:Uma2 family endonuclease
MEDPGAIGDQHPDSEPEPDLAMVRGPAGRYVEHHPGPEDVALVVEVAESSLAHDREAKGRIYARARIDEYWLLNLVEGRLEVHTEPSSRGAEAVYGRRLTLGTEDRVPLVLEGREVAAIAVRDLFPRG